NTTSCQAPSPKISCGSTARTWRRVSALNPLAFQRSLFDKKRAEAEKLMLHAGAAAKSSTLPISPIVDLEKVALADIQSTSWDACIRELAAHSIILLSQYQSLPECRQFTARLCEAIRANDRKRSVAVVVDTLPQSQQIYLDQVRSEE